MAAASTSTSSTWRPASPSCSRPAITTSTSRPGRPTARLIAYVTKRGADPDRHLNFDVYLIEPRAGAVERKLTQFHGRRPRSVLGNAPGLVAGRQAHRVPAGRRGQVDLLRALQLAVVDVASGATTLPAAIDRSFTKPRWSKDGRSLYALMEQSRVTHLSQVTWRTGASRRSRTARGSTRASPWRTIASSCSVAVTIAPPNSRGRVARPAALRVAQRLAAGQTPRAGRGHPFPERGRHRDRRLPGQAARLRGRPPLSDDPAHPRRPGVPVQPRVHAGLAGLSPPPATSWSRPIRAAVPGAASISRGRSTPTGATRTCRTCSPGWTTWSRSASPTRRGSASAGAATVAS